MKHVCCMQMEPAYAYDPRLVLVITWIMQRNMHATCTRFRIGGVTTIYNLPSMLHFYPAHKGVRQSVHQFVRHNKMARSQDLGIWATRTMNPSKSLKNLLHCPSNCLVRPTSVVNTAFLLVTPMNPTPHVLSAHACNQNFIMGKGCQQARTYCCSVPGYRCSARGVCALESSSLTSTVQISRKVNIARV